jgi:hypothetical protein
MPEIEIPKEIAAAYEGLMRAKEAFRAEAHRLARELADAKEALKPFAELADVCDYFDKKPDEQICSWRINGKRQKGPTADDCRRARQIVPPLISITGGAGTRPGSDTDLQSPGREGGKSPQPTQPIKLQDALNVSLRDLGHTR